MLEHDERLILRLIKDAEEEKERADATPSPNTEAMRGDVVPSEAQVDAAARALYKDYEETTDEHVARVFDFANEPDEEARRHWEVTVQEMRDWARKALVAALSTLPATMGDARIAGLFPPLNPGDPAEALTTLLRWRADSPLYDGGDPRAVHYRGRIAALDAAIADF